MHADYVIPSGLLDGLRDYRQIDADGTHCWVSRQAVDEAIAILSAIAAAPTPEPDSERFGGCTDPERFLATTEMLAAGVVRIAGDQDAVTQASNLIRAAGCGYRGVPEVLIAAPPPEPKGEAVAWQVQRRSGEWDGCTRECYELTLKTGRYMGYEKGRSPCFVRELFLSPSRAAEVDVRPAFWLVRALVTLAKARLAKTNETCGDNWPAGQEWHELGGSSQHSFMMAAREAAGIPDDEYRAFVESLNRSHGDALDELWSELEKPLQPNATGVGK